MKGRKGSGRFIYTCRKCGYEVLTDVLPSNGVCPDCMKSAEINLGV